MPTKIYTCALSSLLEHSTARPMNDLSECFNMINGGKRAFWLGWFVRGSPKSVLRLWSFFWANDSQIGTEAVHSGKLWSDRTIRQRVWPCKCAWSDDLCSACEGDVFLELFWTHLPIQWRARAGSHPPTPILLCLKKPLVRKSVCEEFFKKRERDFMKKKWNSAEDFVSLLFCRQIAYTLYYLFHVGLYTYLQWFSHPKYELFSPAPQLDLAGCGNNPFPKRTACGLHWAKARQIHMWCLGLLACELEMVSKTGVPCWRTTECPRRHLGFLFSFAFLLPRSPTCRPSVRLLFQGHLDVPPLTSAVRSGCEGHGIHEGVGADGSPLVQLGEALQEFHQRFVILLIQAFLCWCGCC